MRRQLGRGERNTTPGKKNCPPDCPPPGTASGARCPLTVFVACHSRNISNNRRLQRWTRRCPHLSGTCLRSSPMSAVRVYGACTKAPGYIYTSPTYAARRTDLLTSYILTTADHNECRSIFYARPLSRRHTLITPNNSQQGCYNKTHARRMRVDGSLPVVCGFFRTCDPGSRCETAVGSSR